MQNKKALILTVVGIVVLLIAISGTFIVDETQQVIITRFGKPIHKPITTPGLYFKIPFVEDAHFFEKRFLEWDGDANQIPTKGKKFIWVDTYARWRIADPLLFFQRVRDERGAQARLDDILDGETRNAVANHYLREIIRNTNRKPTITELDTLQENDISESFPPITVGREKIMHEIYKNASIKTIELGIELLDVRFKRINYYEEVRKKVYERMIAERKRIADKFRSEGQGKASEIMGNKERELKRIQSESYRKAQEIVGKADAEATTIYARAYNRSQESRDFYRFVKTLETYRNTFSEKDWLLLSTKSEFYRYLENSAGK